MSRNPYPDSNLQGPRLRVGCDECILRFSTYQTVVSVLGIKAYSDLKRQIEDRLAMWVGVLDFVIKMVHALR